ncbi:IS5 family transposase [Caldichromatium japonicum]|uniref:IS5 family transposase n=1 Tax=Caldichromatium japonicum TaxID=2699430 RepID=UPI001FEBBB2C|nr:IS5 family transposase [Caldichromatium japonicum]
MEQLLPGKKSDPGCTARDNRRVVEAVLWIMRTGCLWRDLPAELGHWHRTYVRFSRWREKGVWERVAAALQGDADMEHLFIDSTIVCAHSHSAGAPKKAGQQEIGRLRGGLTTKLHVAVDALGNPLRVILSAGQVADIEQAAALIQDQPTECVIADKGYDSDALVETVTAQGSQAVIPPRSNRLNPRSFNRHLYKNRNLIKRFFCRIQQFRRIATRYDKLASSSLSFVYLACTIA